MTPAELRATFHRVDLMELRTALRTEAACIAGMRVLGKVWRMNLAGEVPSDSPLFAPGDDLLNADILLLSRRDEARDEIIRLRDQFARDCAPWFEAQS